MENTLIGRDSHVRGAVLRLAGSDHLTVLRHPVQWLYPLEINCCVGKPQDKEPQHNLKNVGTMEVEESTDVADDDDTDTSDDPKGQLHSKPGIK